MNKYELCFHTFKETTGIANNLITVLKASGIIVKTIYD